VVALNENPVGRVHREYVSVSHAVSEPTGRTTLHAVPTMTLTSETAGRVGVPLARVVAVKVELTHPTVTVAVVGVL
jgi:hypothetical protein